MAIKVLVADDHRLFREGLINLLRLEEDIHVVDDADDGQTAYKKATLLLPDLLITDIAMSGMNGIELTKKIKQQYPKIKVLALSMHSDKSYVHDLLHAGADGYMLKNCNIQQLSYAIKSVCRGHKYLSDDLTSLVIDGYLAKEKKQNSNYEQLSEREKEIFHLFAEGNSPKEIAGKLFISSKTVASHKQNILDKLQLNTSADIVKFAVKKGLVHC